MPDYILKDGCLYHYGIFGQKWGRRRFQNEDGTYTEEGKRRRRKEDGYSDDYKKAAKLRKKSTKELSTKEIEELNRRDNAVAQYNRNNKSKNIGEDAVKKLGNKILEKTTEAIAVAAVAYGTKYVSNWYQENKDSIKDVINLYKDSWR